METLVNTIHWRAKDHPSTSRGMLKSGGSFLATVTNPVEDIIREKLTEECVVMTRRQVLFFANLSRTSILLPGNSKEGAVLWWNINDENILVKLHKNCVDICSEIGFSEFCIMSEAKGLSADLYWQEMLEENARYLKRHS